MSIPSAPGPVNVRGAPRRDPPPPCPSCLDLRVFDPARGWYAVRNTRWNRDLVELVHLAQQLAKKLDAFSEAHDSTTLAGELIARGLLAPEEVNDPLVCEVTDPADYVLHDVGALRWAATMFASVADGYARPIASPTAEDESDDATPCAVIGGKAVAS